jgi:hypothetical protein
MTHDYSAPDQETKGISVGSCIYFYNGQELRDSVRAIVERFMIDEEYIEGLNDKYLYKRAIIKKNKWK